MKYTSLSILEMELHYEALCFMWFLKYYFPRLFSVPVCLWRRKFILCEVELKSEVLYMLWIKAILKVLLFSSAYIHYTHVELTIVRI
jgi:hypothetical protein